jgi:hypothetical protein
MAKRKIRYGRRPCPICREMVTKNALGRAAHIRSCHGRHATEKMLLAASKRRERDESALARLRHHVTGAIERGEKQAIAGKTTED